jgi:hypothetical protein
LGSFPFSPSGYMDAFLNPAYIAYLIQPTYVNNWDGWMTFFWGGGMRL